MLIGKLLGFGIGYKMGGFAGAILGALIGHWLVDRQISALVVNRDPKKAQATFFRVTFQVMGAVAKSDGRVSQHEIATAEAVMDRMGLAGERRREAISRFQEGKSDNFDLDSAIGNLRRDCGLQPKLLRFFIEVQLQVAAADGRIDPAEEALLLKVAGGLGVRAAEMQRLLDMIRAQQQFGGGAQNKAGPDAVKAAYAVLGVTAEQPDAEIKRAYRKLMSEHHPDKLAAKGLPDDMLRVAEEKAQQITAAYDAIKNSRGMR